MTITVPERNTVDRLGDAKIIDCDAHWTEPPDLWSARVPKALHDKIPHQKTVDGRTDWYLNDEIWASTGGNTIGTGRKKVRGSHMLQPFSAIDSSSWSVNDRLELLDEMGIWAQILYPNGIGFASNHVFAIEDLGQRQMVLTVYNDYLVEVQDASAGRLFPQGLLPIWDMDLTVKEMNRLISKGMRGFTLSDRPELIGLSELPEPYFEPMWDIFNESGTVVNFHVGAGNRRETIENSRRSVGIETNDTFVRSLAESTGVPVERRYWRTFGPQRRMVVSATQGYMSNARMVANMCLSNLFDRFPKLKIASVESGIGWVPFVLEAMEYQFDEITLVEEAGFAKRRPTEYFHDHISVMFWFERAAPAKLVEEIGIKNILVETDVPHPTALFPNPREHYAEVLGGLSDEAIRRILQDNAVELYHVPL